MTAYDAPRASTILFASPKPCSFTFSHWLTTKDFPPKAYHHSPPEIRQKCRSLTTLTRAMNTVDRFESKVWQWLNNLEHASGSMDAWIVDGKSHVWITQTKPAAVHVSACHFPPIICPTEIWSDSQKTTTRQLLE